MSDASDAAPAVPAEAAALAEALARQDALLHEIDHRVKNNLQLVASLVLLQSRRTSDEAARAALKGVLARVTAVATVHRRLFQDDPLSFEVADFVRDLTGDLAQAAGRDDLEMALDLEHVSTPATAAAPLALVINELLGNALRHAFPPPRGGSITVSLRAGDGHCRLTIADDGAGLRGQPPGFGLTVVKLLCQQLRAEFELVDTSPGVRATVVVPMTAAAT